MIQIFAKIVDNYTE